MKNRLLPFYLTTVILLSNSLPTIAVSTQTKNSAILTCDLQQAQTIQDNFSKFQRLISIAQQYIEAGEGEKASQVLSQAVEVGKSQQNETVFLNIISTKYFESGKPDKGLDIIYQTFQIVSQSTQDNFEKINYYKSIVPTFAEYKQHERVNEILSAALNLADVVKNNYSKVDILIEIASSYAKIGEKEKSSALLSRSLKLVTNIQDNLLHATFLGQIASLYAQNKQNDTVAQVLSQALSIAKKIKGNENINTHPNKFFVFSNIAVNYAAIGQYNKAIAIANTIKEESFKARTLIEISEIYNKNKQINQATPLLSQALQSALKIKDALERNTVLSLTASTYAKIGQYNQAIQVTSYIHESHLTDILGNIVSSSAQQNLQSEILLRSLKVISKIKNDEFKTSSLAKVVTDYKTTVQKQKITQVLSQVQKEAQTLKNVRQRATILIEIAKKYAEAGNKSQATSILSQALQGIAPLKDGETKYERFGFDRGYGDYTELENPLSKPYLLEAIALAYANLGEINQASQIVKTIKDSEAQVSAFTEIAGKYLEAGQKDKGLEILSHALTAAESIAVEAFADKALQQIMDRYIAGELYDEARSATKNIKLLIWRIGSLQRIADRYLIAGNKDKAIETLSEAREVAKLIKEKVDSDRENQNINQRLGCYQSFGE